MRALDFFLEFVNISAFLGLAEFFLDRLDLLVQVILALGFFHLALDAATDALFNLQNINFSFEQAEQLLQP